MKTIVFTGTLPSGKTRTEATKEAEKFGYSVSATIKKTVDYVIVGANAGVKEEKAKSLGIQCITEEQWLDMIQVAGSNGVSTIVKDTDVKPSQNKRPLDTSEDKPTKARKTQPLKSPQQTLQGGKTIVFTGTLPSGKTRAQATKEAEDHGYTVSATIKKSIDLVIVGLDAGSKADKAKQYNIKCISEEDWLKMIPGNSTPNDTQPPKDDNDDIENGKDASEIQPKTILQDGETMQVKSDSSDSSYTIKHTGNHYYCTCMGWKTQNAPVDKRTCKHLKQVLGQEYESFRCGDTKSTRDFSAKVNSVKLLLANKWEEHIDPKGYWMSEKLDGVRAFWDHKRKLIYSRLGNPFPAPDWFIEALPKDISLDGELFGGRGQFQKTVSIVKTSGSTFWNTITYQVFDAPFVTGGFEKRLDLLMNLEFPEFIKCHEHRECLGLEDMQEALQKIQEEGGEGLMLRKPKSEYVGSRSNTLLKVKTFYDGEAEIIGHDIAKTGKHVGTLGAYLCRMKSGKTFKVGTGLTDKDRQKPHKVGSLIVYKCQELTDDGVPRFPVYVGLAADKTEAKDPEFCKKSL
ncbi:hypothetical protein HDV02_000247 [Globomyces sp. JEL0801]|nr:hypothetical protein HDV02_000247 [Globomyces sp. JEL0801]